MTQTASNAGWGSRLGFILASAGSAVGLGAIWKFPYMAGTNGGSVFMLPYIFFTLTVGIALLIAEFAMGRAGRRGAVGSLRAVAGRYWGFFGGVGVFTVFLILSFYSIVGGWCLKYTVDAFGHLFLNTPVATTSNALNAEFGTFVSNISTSSAYLVGFLLLTALVVVGGVQAGIERLSKVLMPTLFILMVILIVRGVTLPGGIEGVKYLFYPRWDQFTEEALINAMGFCFFSLSLGAGTMITYGSYLSHKSDLPSSVGWVAFLGIVSSLLGGLMVMPAVFAFHFDPAAGPGLTFVTMPAVFAQMPLGSLFGVIFFVCLVVAALTSSVSMLEACTVLLTQETKLTRGIALLITVLGCLVVGFVANLSFGPWADVKFAGKNIFELLDYVTSNIGMPLSTFGIAIAAAWVAWKTTSYELQTVRTFSPATLLFTRIMIGVVSPLFVVCVVATNL